MNTNNNNNNNNTNTASPVHKTQIVARMPNAWAVADTPEVALQLALGHATSYSSVDFTVVPKGAWSLNSIDGCVAWDDVNTGGEKCGPYECETPQEIIENLVSENLDKSVKALKLLKEIAPHLQARVERVMRSLEDVEEMFDDLMYDLRHDTI